MGTNGEFPSFDVNERMAVAEAAAKFGGGLDLTQAERLRDQVQGRREDGADRGNLCPTRRQDICPGRAEAMAGTDLALWPEDLDPQVVALGPETQPLKDFLHFGCTSEDINNLSYALMLRAARSEGLVPVMRDLRNKLTNMARDYAATPMLSRTHGQTASPTTLGTELTNVAARLERTEQAFGAVAVHGGMLA